MGSRNVLKWLIATILSLASIAFVAVSQHRNAFPEGWDFRVYEAALTSLDAGRDPYLDAANIQREFHRHTHPEQPAT